MMARKKMGNSAYIRFELERLRQRAALAAEEIHNGTKDLADPEICVEKKKNFGAQHNAMIDGTLQEIEKLGRAEEWLDEELEKVLEEGKEEDEVLEDGEGGGRSA